MVRRWRAWPPNWLRHTASGSLVGHTLATGTALRPRHQRRPQGRIEALHMSHLYLHLVQGSQPQQFPSLMKRLRDRLFDKNVFACAHGFGGEFEVRRRGRHDVHRVTFGQKFVQRFVAFRAVLGDGGGGVFIVGVVKTREFPALGGEDAFQVDFAEVAGAEKGYFH